MEFLQILTFSQIYLNVSLVIVESPSFHTVKMLGLILLLTCYGTIVGSTCFLPEERPPFTVGLNTTAEPNTTLIGKDKGQLKEEIERLRDYESNMEAHIVSLNLRETDFDEWTECFSNSITFNFADGPGSALNYDEWRILVNTYTELITNFTTRNGSAEFIDDHTIQVKFIRTARGQFGFLRGVLPWITALSDVDHNDGEIGWESWVKLRLHIDDKGLIDEFILVSAQFTRQIFGAILSLYVTTSGPIGQDMGPSETLTIFGYNAIVVILFGVISVLTILVGICVYLSMRVCARRGSKPVVYQKVEIVPDIGMDQ